MPGNPVTLTDPRAMRALAHPARMAIWGYLALNGPSTATACADVAGLSPSACSYHLRALARYGIVEEDPDSAADGRQRPWRVRIVAFNIENVTENPAADLAGRFLTEAIRADAEQSRARYLNRQSEYPADWQELAGWTHDVAIVTPAELRELKAKLQEVMDQYRRLDPATRTPGALPVRMGFDMYPYFEPEEAK